MLMLRGEGLGADFPCSFLVMKPQNDLGNIVVRIFLVVQGDGLGICD